MSSDKVSSRTSKILLESNFFKFRLFQVLFRHDEPHGPGDVYFIWQTGANTQLLATTGSDGTVALFNRQGQLQERIVLTGLCAGTFGDGILDERGS